MSSWSPDRFQRPPTTVTKPQDHPDVVTVCRLPFRDARLLVGALQAAGIRAGTSDYENRNLRSGMGTFLFDVLVEREQLEKAREVAAAVLEPGAES